MRNSAGGETIDVGICLWLPGPASFTGEDCAELQVHGGPAVVAAMLEAIGRIDGTRLAEPGEFTRRAFENGRIDLTEVEGLADLIGAQTQAQRRQALAQAQGGLRDRLEDWRSRIVRMRAMVEAEFDFAEEEDVPEDVAAKVGEQARQLAEEIAAALDDQRRGEIVRDGFEVVVAGVPNAGKSSLLNALAGRDVAIVTEEAGTTRDIIEVQLDLGGMLVVLCDTAGIREAPGAVEREGVRRARERAARADLVLWLDPLDGAKVDPDFEGVVTWRLKSKDNSGTQGGISVKRDQSIKELLSKLQDHVSARAGAEGSALVTRQRHREALKRCLAALEGAAEFDSVPELKAEELRRAGEWIGRLSGRIDVEDLLDVVFREFCIGK